MDKPGPKPGQGDVGVDLLEADLDVAPADPPAAGDVAGVVLPGEEIADPLHESALEPVDLGLAARDDLARIGVALDLGVEVVDQVVEARLQQRGGGDNPLGVGVGPTHVGLELAITVKEPIRVHLDPHLSNDPKKNPRPAVRRLRGHSKPRRTTRS